MVAFIGCLLILWHLYMPIAQLGEPSSFEEAYAEHVWWDAMEIGSKPIMESMIDSKLAVDGSIEEYKDRVVGFSQKEGVDLDEILALVTRGFSWKEGVDLVEGFSSVVQGFEVHG
jgi:hypothetical protein